MRKILIIALLLVGCKSNDIPPTPPPAVISHPVWPSPVSSYHFDWKVLTVDDKVYVGLEYDQSVDFRVFMEDIKRYIKDSNNLICFYRETLKEMRCYQQKAVDKTTK